MKKLLLTLLVPALAVNAMAGNWFGPGPWSDGAYYPGGLDGKYVGIVTGNNIAGVLGFAIKDGAPPFRTSEQQSASSSIFETAVAINTETRADVLQNYFSIFVEGRTYNGLTIAGINIEDSSVAGALQGTDPVGNAPPPTAADLANNTGITTVSITPVTIGTNTVLVTNITRQPPVFANSVSILARGLSGGFTANINNKKSIFTFKGTGQLNTPANPQTITASGYVQSKLPLDPPIGVPSGILTNVSFGGSYQTTSTPFNVSGIRTSFFANNPTAIQDAANSVAGGN